VTGDLRTLIRVLRIMIRDFAVVVFVVVAVGAVVIDGWVVLRVSLKKIKILFYNLENRWINGRSKEYAFVRNTMAIVKHFSKIQISFFH
jgi:hypothetical protein